MILAATFMILATMCTGLWMWLKLREKKLQAVLQKFQHNLDGISVHTSDQQLAKKGYFDLVSRKGPVEIKITRCQNNQRAVFILTVLLTITGVAMALITCF